MISGSNAASAIGTTAWKAASQPASPVPAGRGMLIALPGADGPPRSDAAPVPGNSAPYSWIEIVSTRGSSQKIACGPSP